MAEHEAQGTDLPGIAISVSAIIVGFGALGYGMQPFGEFRELGEVDVSCYGSSLTCVGASRSRQGRRNELRACNVPEVDVRPTLLGLGSDAGKGSSVPAVGARPTLLGLGSKYMAIRSG